MSYASEHLNQHFVLSTENSEIRDPITLNHRIESRQKQQLPLSVDIRLDLSSFSAVGPVVMSYTSEQLNQHFTLSTENSKIQDTITFDRLNGSG